jgi:hypothetical protein
MSSNIAERRVAQHDTGTSTWVGPRNEETPAGYVRRGLSLMGNPTLHVGHGDRSVSPTAIRARCARLLSRGVLPRTHQKTKWLSGRLLSPLSFWNRERFLGCCVAVAVGEGRFRHVRECLSAPCCRMPEMCDQGSRFRDAFVSPADGYRLERSGRSS